MKKYKIQIKEVGHDHILTPECRGDKSLKEVIEFFGLREPDVEWYKIKIEDENDTDNK